YVTKDNQLHYAGNRVTEVVDTLVGGADGRSRLRDFLSDGERIGFLHFVAECMTSPEVVSVKDDVQERSFAKLIEDLSTNNSPVRVLDFGAGRGRLADALAKGFAAEPETSQRIQYYAYDP